MNEDATFFDERRKKDETQAIKNSSMLSKNCNPLGFFDVLTGKRGIWIQRNSRGGVYSELAIHFTISKGYTTTRRLKFHFLRYERH